MVVEHIGDGGLEQLLLALEVVVERPHADVGRLSDLQHRHVQLARGDEALRGLDQGCAGALLSPLEAVDRALVLVAHALTIADNISFEDFVRTS